MPIRMTKMMTGCDLVAHALDDIEDLCMTSRARRIHRAM
jgi:hypothetical protein